MLGVALVLIVGILIFILRRYRHKLRKAQVSGPILHEMPGDDGRREMDGRPKETELATGKNASELHGNSWHVYPLKK